MRECAKCGAERPEADFITPRRNAKNRLGPSPWCSDCREQQAAASWGEVPSRRLRDGTVILLRQRLRTMQCVSCGNGDPRKLRYVPPKVAGEFPYKRQPVYMLKQNYSRLKVMRAADACTIQCVDCGGAKLPSPFDMTIVNRPEDII